MGKIKKYLKAKFVDKMIGFLSRPWLELRNTYTRTWMEEGVKTHGRLRMIESTMYAMKKIYGDDFETLLGITSFGFSEDADKITLNIGTSKPGRVIGKGGENINKTAEILTKILGKKVEIRITETETLFGIKYKEDW